MRARHASGKERTYSISELAQEFDITPRTIRYYEDEGLITPTRMQLHSMIQLIEARRHSLRQQLEDIQMVMAELDAAEQRCIHSLGGLKTDGD